MQIKLRISDKIAAELGTAAEHSFDETGGTIGRGAGNNWVLPDPKRVLSSRHAIILFDRGAFAITDTSTNGVFLGDETEPLGRGNMRALRHGDRLTMGDIRMDVTLEASPLMRAAPVAPAPAPRPQAAIAPLEPFAPVESGQALRRRQPIAFGDPPPPVAPAPPPPPAAPPPASFRATLPHDFQPLAENLPPAPAMTPAGPPGLPADWDNILGDLLPAGPARPEEPHTHFTTLPPVPPPRLAASFAPPQPPAAAPALGPFDPFPAPVMPATSLPPAFPDPFPPMALPDPAPRQAAPMPMALPDPMPPMGFADMLPPDAVPEEVLPEETAPSTGAAAALAVLLKAAGIEPEERSEADCLQILHNAGEALRLAADGVVDVLAGRKLFKTEIRVANTTLRPVANNAFKFSPTGQAALASLLTRRDPGYLPLDAALSQSFDDIKAHEIAVIAAIDSAMQALLDRLNPKTLQSRLAQRQGLKGGIGAKTRYWDAFIESYDELAGNAADTFREVFGEQFGEVYAEQLERMKGRGNGG